MNDIMHGCTQGTNKHASVPRLGMVLLLVAGCACGAALSGCSKGLRGPAASSRQILRSADFEREGAEPPVAASVVDPRLANAPIITPDATPRRVIDITTSPTAPALSPSARPVNQPVFVDAKIGDVNGKPVFASAFFDRGTPTSPPLGPRLAAEAARLGRAEWLRFSRDQISQTLQGFIVDELLEAEARAELSAEQRMGLRAFIQSFQRDVLSENRGSRAQAEQTLGRSIDDAARSRETEVLIRRKLQMLERRVFVTWRDITQEFEKRPDLYNPPSIARFRVIVVNESRPEDVQVITSLLESGRPFAEVALDPANLNSFLDDAQIVRTFPGPLSEAKIYEIPELNAAATSLSQGESVGPIRIESSPGRASLYWIYLEDLVAEQRGLYDNQLVIASDLQATRSRREREAYINRLAERASFTSLDEMVNRLLTIAAARYLSEQPRS